MSEKDPNKVRDWNRVQTRIDPDTEQRFQQKLKENGDSQSEVIRRAIRNYTKD
jgi:hypothetical protein